ncbi:MAG TPA: hypothetical protein DCS55_24455 [Acidimicrobiaceae bacterium]|nr:hypothetical protein [Acidimicrobiaceae bacterium]
MIPADGPSSSLIARSARAQPGPSSGRVITAAFQYPAGRPRFVATMSSRRMVRAPMTSEGRAVDSASASTERRCTVSATSVLVAQPCSRSARSV